MSKVAITPLNCSSGEGMNFFMHMMLASYTASTQRALYAKDVDMSWFRFKSSSTQTPYIEPALFGAATGDTLIVEFDALLVSGTSEITVDLLTVSYDNIVATNRANPLPAGSLSTSYRHFRVPIMVRDDTAEKKVVINIRPTGFSSEIIIKNVTVEIVSANSKLSLADCVARYDNQVAMMQCINLYCGTNVRTGYNNITDLVGTSALTFPDSATLAFDGGATKFKGLMAAFLGNGYAGPMAVYVEYKLSGSSGGLPVVSSNRYGYNGGFIDNIFHAELNVSGSDFVKKIIYFNNRSDSRLTFLDVGNTVSATTVQYRRLRFSMPRFDDAPKVDPNRLEELYTNLGTKLRAP